MNWKDIANDVGKAAPLLGGLLDGPAGGAIGSIVASALGAHNDPDSVLAGLANPDAAVKLRQIESDQAVNLQKLAVTAEQNRLEAATQAAQAVNASIQIEAKSNHWPTYSWRPFIGFAVGFIVIASGVLILGVFTAEVLGAKGAAVAVAQMPTTLGALAAVSGSVLPILGIASYYRGKMQADPAIPTDNRG